MGQDNQIINPIIFRLGIIKDWNLKFMEKKHTDLSNYYFNGSEILDYIYIFFNKYTFKVSNIKLYYSKNSIKLYIIFYISNISLKKLNIKMNKAIFSYELKLKLHSQLVIFNVQFSGFKSYIKLKHLKQIFKYIKNKDKNWFFFKNLVINYIFCRLNIFKFLCFVKHKYINFKYRFLLNKFFNKLLISLKYFLNNKTCIVIIFKQLIKNMDSKPFFKTSKQLLMFYILKLRKFDKLISFKTILNLLYYSSIFGSKAIIISYILSSKLPNIKETKNVNLFFKFFENILKLFFIKLNIIKGLKVILKGNLTKNKRASKVTITIGDIVNNSKISNNLTLDKTTCFTSKGTLGIKTYILN